MFKVRMFKVRRSFVLNALFVFILAFSTVMLWSLPIPVQAQERVSVQEETPPQHGEFGGKKFCYNTGKEKNCDCHRMCFNGNPGRDPKCKNDCYEDHCKCHTMCNS